MPQLACLQVLCSFKIGAAWLHLIDGVFVPEAAYEMYPQDNFEWLETYDGGIRAIFQASDYWYVGRLWCVCCNVL